MAKKNNTHKKEYITTNSEGFFKSVSTIELVNKILEFRSLISPTITARYML